MKTSNFHHFAEPWHYSLALCSAPYTYGTAQQRLPHVNELSECQSIEKNSAELADEIMRRENEKFSFAHEVKGRKKAELLESNYDDKFEDSEVASMASVGKDVSFLLEEENWRGKYSKQQNVDFNRY